MPLNLICLNITSLSNVTPHKPAKFLHERSQFSNVAVRPTSGGSIPFFTTGGGGNTCAPNVRPFGPSACRSVMYPSSSPKRNT